MDTTLRDGEQTSGVSFVRQEKLSLARLLLEDLKVDRIEVASALVSEGEFDIVRSIAQWGADSGHLPQIEVLGFVDGRRSVDWVNKAGIKVMNLLCKGSQRHCSLQLGKKPEEHAADIRQTVMYAQSQGIRVNVYLEDWSNGIQNSPDYVFMLIDELRNLPVQRFMLPDTLGILTPTSTARYCRMMLDRYPDLQFDFHAHNDYDLAVANVFAAVEAGIQCVHTTVNGLGERAGNAPLSSVVAVLNDHLHLKTNVDEKQIHRISKIVETYSGIRIPANKPVIGESVFTQVAGVHADGDLKNKLYYNDLLPERFGRTRVYALGKTSGKANIRKNLQAMGIQLDDATMKKVTERIIALGDKKQMVTPEDLPYIVSDILKTEHLVEKFILRNYSLSISKDLRPIANLSAEVDGQIYNESSTGDGQYDAFVKALWKICDRLHRPHPVLVDYAVTIPPGGRTDAFVQTVITWDMDGRIFKTHGLDGDQTEAAIKATVKMLNTIY